MRTNLPVTQKEVMLKEGEIIVSKTDLKGQITYINQTFLDISGFSPEELLGQPHNIVRHPDMPSEAFADLWRDLKEGRPWTGMVKNRCKNGDHYWVTATVTPIREGGQVTGYMSVRRTASRQAVETCENAYREFRENRAGNKRISHGTVVSGSEGFLSSLSLAARLKTSLTGMVLVALIVAVVGWLGLRDLEQNVEELNRDNLLPMTSLAQVGKRLSDNSTQILLSLQHDPDGPHVKMHDHPLQRHLDAIDKNVEVITTEWARVEPAMKSEEQRKAAAAFTEVRQRYVNDGLKPARKALAEGRFGDANTILLKQINPLYAEASEKLDLVYKLEIQAGSDFIAESAERARYARIQMILVVALALIGGALVARSLLRLIMRSLDDIGLNLQAISSGDYTRSVDASRNDELGKVMQYLLSMQTQQGFNVAETRRVAEEMTRIKIALDNVSTGVMIADGNRNITYTNHSVVGILKGAETAIKSQLPNFNSERLLGVNIDSFHKNPAHQAGLLSGLRQPHTAAIEIGGRHLVVTANPVINERGERLGTVAEWKDRTAEVLVEQEIAQIVSAATLGELGMRLSVDGKTGFFQTLAKDLNRLLDTTQQALSSTSEVLSRVAGGDLTQTIDADFSGIFGQLKEDTNRTIERLREVVGSIKDATETINTAAKEIAAGNSDLSARTEEQASSLEETSSSMEQLNSTVRQNAENARQANELASRSNEIALRGGQMVKDVVSTMNGIQESSQRIADIIGVINGIAFQTNILALNAAVEAARAGEQGRGFAVVASEVRNLAQRSANAAKEIKELIDDSVGKVDSGARLVGQAGATMDEVVTSFQRVAALVTDISNASREQSAGIEQVTQAVSQMDEVTQQNAALVEEASAAAESLEEQAQGLVSAVGVFRLHAGAMHQSAPASPPPPRPVALARPTASVPVQRSGGQKPAPLPSSPATDDFDDDEWSEF